MKNLNYSRLMLGTVQFGLNYGVANTSGKPSFDVCKQILKEAYDGGINALDTAPEYGDSEEVIGKALKELGLDGKYLIVTKIPKINDGVDPEKFIRESLEESLRRLQIDCIQAALIHVEEDDIYLDVLKSMVDRGLIQSAGISLNSVAFNTHGGDADCLQVPCSMLDHRFDNCFGQGDRHCFIRGAYLQGMLLMPEEKIFIPEIRERRRQLEKLGMPMAEMALRYLFAKPGSKSVLTGVENVEQLRENVRISKLDPLSDAELEEVNKIVFPELEEMFVAPWLWSKYKKLHNIQ